MGKKDQQFKNCSRKKKKKTSTSSFANKNKINSWVIQWYIIVSIKSIKIYIAFKKNEV